MICIRRARGDERAHRAGLGDAFLEDLSVLGFFVVEQGVHVDRLVKLADAGVDTHLAEQRFHAKGAGFVRDNGHDELADLRVAQQFSQQADEDHGGGNVAALGAFVKLLEVRFRNRADRFRSHFAFREVAAQLLAALLHVGDFRAVVRGTIERSVVKFIVGDGNAEA